LKHRRSPLSLLNPSSLETAVDRIQPAARFPPTLPRFHLLPPLQFHSSISSLPRCRPRFFHPPGPLLLHRARNREKAPGRRFLPSVTQSGEDRYHLPSLR